MLAQILGSKLSNDASYLMCLHPGKQHHKYRQGITSIAFECFWEDTRPPFPICQLANLFSVTSLKTVLIRFHVNEKAAMFVLRFRLEEKQQREQAAARCDGNSSGIREAGKPLLTSTLLPQPPKPLPSPVLELTTKLLSCFGSEIKLTCYPSSFTW